MKRATSNRYGQAGFTLIEVMAALAVLGTAVFVLMEAHYGALDLFALTEEETDLRLLLEEAAARAELGVLEGTYSDSQDFGPRYDGYSWAYDAMPAGSGTGDAGSGDAGMEEGGLYEVMVTVTGPEEERSLMLYVFDIGMAGDDITGLGESGGSGNRSRSSRTDGRSGAT